MAGGRGGIDSDLNVEYPTGEDVDSEFDGINEYSCSESDEENEPNEIEMVDDDILPLHTQFEIRNVDEDVLV